MDKAILAAAGAFFTPTIHKDTYPFIGVHPGSLAGRFVLITGGSRGVGKAMAISYARAGASGIAIAARSTPTLSSARDAILAAAKEENPHLPLPNVLTISADLSQRKDVEEMAAKVRDGFGRLDVLINNAGTLEDWMPITESDPEVWWKTFQINVFGIYLMCRSFIPLLQETQEGLKTIVQITSAGAHVASKGASAYQSTKTWLLRLNDFIIAEYGGEQGLLAFCAHPGSVQTELAMNMPKHMHALLSDTPELCGDTIVWLTKERREWLADRYISVAWDMEELERKREEIIHRDLLKVRLRL